MRIICVCRMGSNLVRVFIAMIRLNAFCMSKYIELHGVLVFQWVQKHFIVLSSTNRCFSLNILFFIQPWVYIYINWWTVNQFNDCFVSALLFVCIRISLLQWVRHMPSIDIINACLYFHFPYNLLLFISNWWLNKLFAD